MILAGRRTDGIIVDKFNYCRNFIFQNSTDDNTYNNFLIAEFDMTIHNTSCNPNRGSGYQDYNPVMAAQIMLDGDSSFRVRNGKHFFSDAIIYFDTEVKYHVKVFIDTAREEYDVWVTRQGEEPIRMAERYDFNFQYTGNHVLGVCITSNEFEFSIENINCYSQDAKPDMGPDRNHIPCTYHVGPDRAYKTLQEVANRLKPGDTVFVDGDNKYPGQVTLTQSGTQDARIRIIGIKVNGKRPVIDGEGIHQDCVELSGHYYDFIGFEIRNAKRCGIHHHAHSIVIRDTIVHDCPGGILSYDVNTGSITVEFCEIYNCGNEQYEHQLYIATDEKRFPGAVFRLQHSYIHDGKGGHNVKSRAERDEIYYNWLEDPYYHNLELIGPDPDYNPVDEDLAREDSDVAGNVLVSNRWYMVRAGGDGTGQSKGRYRFVNNTFIFKNASGMEAFRLMWGIESLEVRNNVFFGTNGTKLGILHEDKVEWVSGKRVIWGSNNWVQDGVEVPEGLTETIFGSHPGFKDIDSFDLRPVPGSPLAGAGCITESGMVKYPFPNPLHCPEFFPPMRVMETPDGARKRTKRGNKIDIGAFDVTGGQI